MERLSPVAIGTGLRRATSTIALMLVCGTGSSNHAGRNWLHALRRTAPPSATLKRQWPSISRSTDVAHGVADGADDVDAEVEIVARTACARRCRTDRTSAPCSRVRDDLFGLFGEALRRARAAIPAVGVGAQLFVAASAPQVVDRLVAGLADDVPAARSRWPRRRTCGSARLRNRRRGSAAGRSSRPETGPCR